MPTRPVITGVTFAADITAPVEVTEPATWGYFANGLNVQRAASKEAAYASARRIANHHQSSVQIYANTGNGWRQVDVIPRPDRETCEWWPERNDLATGVEGEGCVNTAVISVGASRIYHLCDVCAGLPRFRRMRRNGRLFRVDATPSE